MNTSQLIIGLGASLFTLGMLAILLGEYRDKQRRKQRVKRERKGGSV